VRQKTTSNGPYKKKLNSIPLISFMGSYGLLFARRKEKWYEVLKHKPKA
jgi:hypothetical protein